MKNATEHAIIKQLCVASLLDVMTAVIERFELENGTKPEVIIFNRSLRTAFIREVSKVSGLGISAAIAEPFWYIGTGKSIPVVFTLHPSNEFFLIAQDNSLRKDYRL